LGERNDVGDPLSECRDHGCVGTLDDEERDVQQLAEAAERPVDRARDRHRRAPRLGVLDLALDHPRCAGVDVRRCIADRADRRQPRGADALRARLERGPERAVEVPLARGQLHECVHLRVRDA
jgi:hypothetical protein